MDCPTNSSVFEDKNFSLVGESVMEWKFRTCFSIGLAMVFPIRWNCVLLVASSLSSNSLCFSFVTFHPSWKAIPSIHSFHFNHLSTLWRMQQVHSISKLLEVSTRRWSFLFCSATLFVCTIATWLFSWTRSVQACVKSHSLSGFPCGSCFAWISSREILFF